MTQILIKRDRDQRISCAGCSKSIVHQQQFAEIDGQKFHLFCAGDEGKLQTCPECFMIDSHCVC